jgi:hypothetical protein
MRPDWMPGAVPTPVRVPRENGKPMIIYWDKECRKPAFCPVRYVPDRAHIDFMRARWTEWWDLLEVLRERLDGKLTRDVLALPIAREPWLVSVDSRGKV